MGPENSISSSHVAAENPRGPFTGPLASLFATTNLSSQDFAKAILDDASERLRVVYFHGTNCPNCAIAEVHLAALSGELKAMPADFHAVDAYRNMDLVEQLGLYGIPAFLFYKRGRLIGRIDSFPTRDEFLTSVRRKV